jgi:hypothetical protein
VKSTTVRGKLKALGGEPYGLKIPTRRLAR